MTCLFHCIYWRAGTPTVIKVSWQYCTSTVPYLHSSADTWCWPKAVSMLGHLSQHWYSIVPSSHFSWVLIMLICGLQCWHGMIILAYTLAVVTHNSNSVAGTQSYHVDSSLATDPTKRHVWCDLLMWAAIWHIQTVDNRRDTWCLSTGVGDTLWLSTEVGILCDCELTVAWRRR